MTSIDRWRVWFAAWVVSSCAFDGNGATSGDAPAASSPPHPTVKTPNSTIESPNQNNTDVVSVVKAAISRTQELRDRALSETLERELLQLALSTPSSDEEVNSYYTAYLDRFVKPEAIEVWRILVGTEEQAAALLARVKNSEAPQKTWSLIAREHSLDSATHFRRGYLGFVRADGTTDVPQVRVSPAVHAAAKLLANNEYTDTPVREGDNWALIWRRGYRAEERTTLAQARPEIEPQLGLAKARIQLNELITALKAKYSSDYHPELLEALPNPSEAAITAPRQLLQAHPADGQPTPRKTDWGER